MLAVFVSFVSFVREDFLLLAWTEAWFLLLPKIDDNHVVTRRGSRKKNIWGPDPLNFPSDPPFPTPFPSLPLVTGP